MYQKIKNKTYSLTQRLKTELSQFCEMPKSGPRYQNHGEKNVRWLCWNPLGVSLRRVTFYLKGIHTVCLDEMRNKNGL